MNFTTRVSVIKLYFSDDNEPFVTFSYNDKTGAHGVFDGKVTEFLFLGRELHTNATIVYDRGIIELTTDDDTIIQMTDLPHLRDVECNRISYDSGEGYLKVGMIH